MNPFTFKETNNYLLNEKSFRIQISILNECVLCSHQDSLFLLLYDKCLTFGIGVNLTRFVHLYFVKVVEATYLHFKTIKSYAIK